MLSAIERGRGGLPRVQLRADDGGSVEAYLHGAHVTSWKTPDGREQLYLSERAVFDGRAAIRGGVPVIFPQFAGIGPLPKHGFARGLEWRVMEAAASGPSPWATFEITASDTTRATWPHEFLAQYRVELVNGSLRLSLAVHNDGDVPFEFTAALHTYLRVDRVGSVRVRGLQGVTYRDATRGGETAVQHDAELTAEGEVNRIYVDVPGIVGIVEGDREVRSSAHGFPDVVVWNPGPGGEAALGDMAPGDAAHMLCIEAAAVATPVTVAPGAAWSGSQRLTEGLVTRER